MPGESRATSWPDTADGDVFRRLEADGFDFSRTCLIDFNVDFLDWPPPRAAIDAIVGMYGELAIFEPSGDEAGYVQFRVEGQLTYDVVITIQRLTTATMKPYGGICESWGVMHDST